MDTNRVLMIAAAVVLALILGVVSASGIASDRGSNHDATSHNSNATSHT